MTDKIEAKVTHRFKANPERVFDAFVDVQKVRLWQRAWLLQSGLTGEITKCEIDPVVGGEFFFSDMREDGEARHWGTYVALDHPTKLAFTWITDPNEQEDPSLVTIILEPEPDGGGTIATLYHEMDGKWADWLEQTETGWISMLLGVDAVLLAEG